jgi:hypothetical protein
MTKHIRNAGTVGIYDPGSTIRGLPPGTWVARGNRGFMYAITFEPDNDDVLAISLHQLVNDGGKVEIGPLVTRRRVDPSRAAYTELLGERGIDLVAKDQVTDQNEILDMDHDGITNAEFQARIEVILHRTISEMAAKVGAAFGSRKFAFITSNKSEVTAAQILDLVWLDDGWEATVPAIVARAEAAGHELSEDSAKKALQRGPYTVVREGAGRRGSTWRRDVQRALTGRSADLARDGDEEEDDDR